MGGKAGKLCRNGPLGKDALSGARFGKIAGVCDSAPQVQSQNSEQTGTTRKVYASQPPNTPGAYRRSISVLMGPDQLHRGAENNQPIKGWGPILHVIQIALDPG